MSKENFHRWSLEHNPLSGITFGRWLKILSDNRFDVDLGYAHRVAFISIMSGFNSLCAAIEKLRFHRALREVVVREDPIFIIGHWRSGTTLLHNLLALDDRLTAPSTFQAVNPSSFLSTNRILPKVFQPFLPARRPMDQMAMSFEAPQEDELALSLLSGMSPYLSLSFPRRAEFYDRYMTFEGVSKDEVEVWKSAFLEFAAKLTLNDDRCIVYKSPAHTGRISVLLEMFPKARFVHIHRDPYVVFQSSRHYFNTAAWYANLQHIDPNDFDDAILKRYQRLYDSFFDQRHLIPSGQWHALSFESLLADPELELKSIYRALNLDHFELVTPKLRDYLATLEGYQRNQHAQLSDDERRRVATHWRRGFDSFGYTTGFEPSGVSPHRPSQEIAR